MAYTLQTSREPFVGGKNILASEHLQFVEAGATLDAQAFGQGKIKLGTLVARNTTSGKFEPYPGDGSDGSGNAVFPSGYNEPAVLNIDVDSNGQDDVVVGEVIIRGSVYQEKLPAAPTEVFKAQNDNIRFVKTY